MAKTSKATRGSASKPPSRKRSSRAHPAARAQVAVRSGRAKPAAPAAKPVAIKSKAAKPKPTAAKPKPTAAQPKPLAAQPKPTAAKPKRAPIADSSPLLRQLGVEEQRAVKQALGGQPTLLECAPRARDAAVFAAAASLAPHPVLVASPRAAELYAQARLLAGVDVIAWGPLADEGSLIASKKRLSRGGPLLVVLEPGQLFDAELRQSLAQAPLALLGIAAAHACSEHAHELSPAYLSLREALKAFTAPVLATCTATSARVVDQVSEAIGAGRDHIIRRESPELERAAQVVRASERKTALFAAILEYGAPGVVLTATPQEADAVFAELNARQVPCVRAHNGMAEFERNAALARFTEPRERLVLVTQSPHANASGLAGCAEANQILGSAAPRADLRFVLHYQAPLSPEQQFEDLAWLAAGGHSLVLADSSDAALVQALLAQQRIKPAAIEAMAGALAQLPNDRPAAADVLALRAGTSRRSAERVLSAFADRNLIVRDNGQISRRVEAEQLAAEGRLLSARFAALRAADGARAESVARYVTSRHGTVPVAASAAQAEPIRHVRA